MSNKNSAGDEMSEQERILQLTTALGLALGALEVINLVPYDFNKDGVLMVIKQLRQVLGTGPEIVIGVPSVEI